MEHMINNQIQDTEHPIMEKKKKKKKERQSRRAQQVISYFKKPGINNAPYAYKLWPKKEKANARSLFAKRLNRATNDDGVEYKFKPEEINKLYSLISSDALNENQKFQLTQSELVEMIMEVVKDITGKKTI